MITSTTSPTFRRTALKRTLTVILAALFTALLSLVSALVGRLTAPKPPEIPKVDRDLYQKHDWDCASRFATHGAYACDCTYTTWS